MSSHYKIVLGLETQVPYHSRQIFQAFLGFVSDYSPDEIIGVGDHLDCPSPSRWNRGTAAEYAGNLQREIDVMKGMFADIRTVFDGVFSLHEGNHESRINTYARTKAPAFADLDCLEVPSLLDYSGFAIRARKPVEQLYKRTSVVTTHGDLIKRVSPTAGATALAHARRFGRSVVCGHTHRMGLLQESDASRTLVGVETGHMMDIKKAEYVLAPNWQAGWVVAEVNENTGRTHFSLVPVSPTGVVTFHG